MKEKASDRESRISSHEQAIEEAVASGKPVERQFKCMLSWHPLTLAEAERAIANGDHAWMRLREARA